MRKPIYSAMAALSLSMTTAAGAQIEQASEAPYAFTADYFVGEWVDGDSCDVDRLVMRADGTLIAPTGGRSTWSLDGNRLTFGTGEGASSFTVQPINRDLVYLFLDNGNMGYSRRC
ncbi:hypothetical protein AAG612_15000 [Citromicrobium bathyomarinum]|uniref:hypothetical protein n=1 Tax=Citromicrobium bathyomarinum TaxID=72174 RepID=UPI00315AF310